MLPPLSKRPANIADNAAPTAAMAPMDVAPFAPPVANVVAAAEAHQATISSETLATELDSGTGAGGFDHTVDVDLDGLKATVCLSRSS